MSKTVYVPKSVLFIWAVVLIGGLLFLYLTPAQSRLFGTYKEPRYTDDCRRKNCGNGGESYADDYERKMPSGGYRKGARGGKHPPLFSGDDHD